MRSRRPAGGATNDAEATARAHLEKLAILPRFAFVAGYDSGFGPRRTLGGRYFAEEIDLTAVLDRPLG